MASYKELLQQREKLEREIAEAKALEFDAVVQEIKQKMLDYGITLADLGLSNARGKGRKGQGRTADAKYRDPVSGVTWSGRGREPRWIVGKDRSQFEIH